MHDSLFDRMNQANQGVQVNISGNHLARVRKKEQFLKERFSFANFIWYPGQGTANSYICSTCI